MTTHTASQHGLGAVPWIGDALAALKTRFARYRAYRVTVHEMETLADRELADLGISRTEIRSIAWDAANAD